MSRIFREKDLQFSRSQFEQLRTGKASSRWKPVRPIRIFELMEDVFRADLMDKNKILWGNKKGDRAAGFMVSTHSPRQARKLGQLSRIVGFASSTDRSVQTRLFGGFWSHKYPIVWFTADTTIKRNSLTWTENHVVECLEMLRETLKNTWKRDVRTYTDWLSLLYEPRDFARILVDMTRAGLFPCQLICRAAALFEQHGEFNVYGAWKAIAWADHERKRSPIDAAIESAQRTDWFTKEVEAEFRSDLERVG